MDIGSLVRPFETSARALAASLKVAAELFGRVESSAMATGRSEPATAKVLPGLRTSPPGADLSTRLSLLVGEAKSSLNDLSGAERICADPSSPRSRAALSHAVIRSAARADAGGRFGAGL